MADYVHLNNGEVWSGAVGLSNGYVTVFNPQLLHERTGEFHGGDEERVYFPWHRVYKIRAGA